MSSVKALWHVGPYKNKHIEHFKERGSLKDRQRLGWQGTILAHTNCYFMTSSRRNRYDTFWKP